MLDKFRDISYVHGLLEEVRKVFKSEGQSNRLNTYPKKKALTNLARMQKKFSDREYIDNLEKSVIYYQEVTYALNEVIGNYLHHGSPDWNGLQVKDIAEPAVQKILKEIVLCQLRFLNSGCHGCTYHHLHRRIANMKKLRDEGHPEYLEEIEYSFIFYSIHFELNKIFLGEFLSEYYLAGVGSSLDAFQVLSAVESRMKMITATTSGAINLGIDIDKDGNLRFLSEEELSMQKNQKKTWRDYWGADFNEIYRRI